MTSTVLRPILSTMYPAMGALAAMKSAGRVSTKRTQKATLATPAKWAWIEGSAGAIMVQAITVNVLVKRRVTLRTGFSGFRLFILPLWSVGSCFLHFNGLPPDSRLAARHRAPLREP